MRKSTVTVLTGVLLLVASGCSGTPDDSDGNAEPTLAAECAGLSTSKTGVTDAVDSPPSGGLEVIESGFAYAYLDTSVEGRSANATAGAIIENTSDFIAGGVRVKFSAYAGEEQVLTTMGWNERPILPGQTMAFGDDFRHFPDNEDERIDRVEVVFDVEQWWPAQNDVYMPPQLIASNPEMLSRNDVPASQQERYDDTGLVVSFDTYSCYPIIVPAGASIVLRDSSGRIIGATSAHGVTKCDSKSIASFEPGENPKYCTYAQVAGNLEADNISMYDLNELEPEVYLHLSSNQVILNFTHQLFSTE